MARKIIAGGLIIISTILLGLSIAGIVLVSKYKEPLTQLLTSRLQGIDNELEKAQFALQSAERELEGTLRTVDVAEESLVSLKADFALAQSLFGGVNGTLSDQLLPGLKASRKNIDQAKSSLEELQTTLKKVNVLPFAAVDFSSDKLLADLIVSAGLMDTQITQVEGLVAQASDFMDNASTLLDGDFTETKQNLKDFLAVVQGYIRQFGGWREQLALFTESLPGRIRTTSIFLTIFLLWFGFSQLSLIQHGLLLWRGSDSQKNLPAQPETPQVAETNPA